ncbi:hypothetical protein ELQ36_15655, partial [Methylococcus capsulatus]|nr:hypothetical protein [Methylococcus capsulatus]
QQVFSLPSAVWLLGLVSLVNDLASELVYPLVPIYLTSVLMAGRGGIFPEACAIVTPSATSTGWRNAQTWSAEAAAPSSFRSPGAMIARMRTSANGWDSA